MNRTVNSIIVHLGWLIFLPLVFANAEQKTSIFKIRNLELPLAVNLIAGDKISSHNAVVTNLINKASDSQSDFVALLDSYKAAGANLQYDTYWIANVIVVTADSSVLNELGRRCDIEFVSDNYPIELITPVESDIPAPASVGIEDGLVAIRANEAWAIGLDGRGSLVCNFDTGVNGNHQALISKYRGNNGGNSTSSWFDPYTQTEYPWDLQGHGTHTMGIMVGSTDSDTVGVAPGAQWIAAGVVERGGGVQRTISDLLAAFQWAADPDGDPTTTDDVPDVINNSWGIPLGYYPACEETFWEAVDNLEAAGVVCVFAAGNEGSNPGTIRTPADRISTNFNSFSIGAVNGHDPAMAVASFSSRGPSGCDGMTIKPEVTAPGVGVRSCGRNGDYVMMSGTSMAAPHVAGAVAILRQFNPHATPDEIKAALMNSASDLGEIGEDNNYGWGVINIRRALDFMPIPETPFSISGGMIISDDGIIAPDENVDLTLKTVNIGGSIGEIEAAFLCVDSRVEYENAVIWVNVFNHNDTLDIGPLTIHTAADINLGEEIPAMLILSASGYCDTIAYTMTIGGEASPAMATIGNDEFHISFSNIGTFGLGERSLTPMGGSGFRLTSIDSEILRNCSLILATDSLHISDNLAGNDPYLADNDFASVNGGQPRINTDGDMQEGFAIYNDSFAENPLGAEIKQRIYCSNGIDEAPIAILEFEIVNLSGSTIEALKVGMFCDWDNQPFTGENDFAGFAGGVGYIGNFGGGSIAGIKVLRSQASSYMVIDNYQVLSDGFSDTEKLAAINSGFENISANVPANYSQIMASGPFDIPSGDTILVAFAMIAGSTYEELIQNALRADDLYNQSTIVEESEELPDQSGLIVNYPNPFNNSTIIQSGTISGDETISIFDIMGRLVNSIPLNGASQVVWDGNDSDGKPVAGGVYFAKTNGESKQGRKMTLLK